MDGWTFLWTKKLNTKSTKVSRTNLVLNIRFLDMLFPFGIVPMMRWIARAVAMVPWYQLWPVWMEGTAVVVGSTPLCYPKTARNHNKEPILHQGQNRFYHIMQEVPKTNQVVNIN